MQVERIYLPYVRGVVTVQSTRKPRVFKFMSSVEYLPVNLMLINISMF